MGKDNKHEQNLKPDGVNREKIDRSQLRYVVVEKRSPSLRSRFWISDHVFGHGSLRDLSEFQKFDVNPRGRPRADSHGSWFESDREFLCGTCGRPGRPRRTFQVQYHRNP
jgi:hypothetical protein